MEAIKNEPDQPNKLNLMNRYDTMKLQSYRRAELEHPDTFRTFNFSVFVTDTGLVELLENDDNELQLHIKKYSQINRKFEYENFSLRFTFSTINPDDALGIVFQTSEGEEYGWTLNAGYHNFVTNDNIMHVYEGRKLIKTIEFVGAITRQIFSTLSNSDSVVLEAYDVRHSDTIFESIPYGWKVVVSSTGNDPKFTNNALSDKAYNARLYIPEDGIYAVNILDKSNRSMFHRNVELKAGGGYLFCKYNIELSFNDEPIESETLLDYNVSKLTIKNLRHWEYLWPKHYYNLFVSTESQSYIEDTILYSLDVNAEEWHRELKLPVLLSRYTDDDYNGNATPDEDGYYPIDFYVRIFSRNPNYDVDSFTIKIYEQTASNNEEGEYEDGYDYSI